MGNYLYVIFKDNFIHEMSTNTER